MTSSRLIVAHDLGYFIDRDLWKRYSGDFSFINVIIRKFWWFWWDWDRDSKPFSGPGKICGTVPLQKSRGTPNPSISGQESRSVGTVPLSRDSTRRLSRLVPRRNLLFLSRIVFWPSICIGSDRCQKWSNRLFFLNWTDCFKFLGVICHKYKYLKK